MKKNKDNTTAKNKSNCNSNVTNSKNNSKNKSNIGFNNASATKSFKLDENDDHSFELRDDE